MDKSAIFRFLFTPKSAIFRFWFLSEFYATVANSRQLSPTIANSCQGCYACPVLVILCTISPQQKTTCARLLGNTIAILHPSFFETRFCLQKKTSFCNPIVTQKNIAPRASRELGFWSTMRDGHMGLRPPKCSKHFHKIITTQLSTFFRSTTRYNRPHQKRHPNQSYEILHRRGFFVGLVHSAKKASTSIVLKIFEA